MNSRTFAIAGILLGAVSAAEAAPVTASDGTDAFFALGWASAGDELCGLKTHRIFLALAKSKGLTDAEVARNTPKIVRASELARQEHAKLGAAVWCRRYERGVLTGNPAD